MAALGHELKYPRKTGYPVEPVCRLARSDYAISDFSDERANRPTGKTYFVLEHNLLL